MSECDDPCTTPVRKASECRHGVWIYAFCVDCARDTDRDVRDPDSPAYNYGDNQ